MAKRISDLTEVTSLASTDLLHVRSTTEDHKITRDNLKADLGIDGLESRVTAAEGEVNGLAGRVQDIEDTNVTETYTAKVGLSQIGTLDLSKYEYALFPYISVERQGTAHARKNVSGGYEDNKGNKFLVRKLARELSLDIRDFGAKINGSESDSAAINRAIVAAIDEEVRSVYIPNGEIAVDDPIDWLEGIDFFGQGRNRTKFIPAAGFEFLQRSSNMRVGGFSVQSPTRVAGGGIRLAPTSSASVARLYNRYFDLFFENIDGPFFSNDIGSSLIESRFDFVHARLCGNAETPACNLEQDNSVNDAFNNIVFNQFNIYGSYGTAFSMISHKSNSVYAGTKNIKFDGRCIIHGTAGGPANADLFVMKGFSNPNFHGLRLTNTAPGYYAMRLDTDRSLNPEMLTSRRPVFGGAVIEDDVYIGEVNDAIIQDVSFRSTNIYISSRANRTRIGFNASRYNNASGYTVTDEGQETLDINLYLLSDADQKIMGRLAGTGDSAFLVGASVSKTGVGVYEITFNQNIGNTDYLPQITPATIDSQWSYSNLTGAGFTVSTYDLSGTPADRGFSFEIVR